MGPTVEDFFALKIRRLRPGANPQTWVPKASTLPLDHRNRLMNMMVNGPKSMEFINNQPPHVKRIIVSAHALRAIVWL
jgi:hypothetical protein